MRILVTYTLIDNFFISKCFVIDFAQNLEQPNKYLYAAYCVIYLFSHYIFEIGSNVYTFNQIQTFMCIHRKEERCHQPNINN